MEFQIFQCPACKTATTFYTLCELAEHRVVAHERPVPTEESLARLACEDGMIGRARTSPWAPGLTHWHALRIEGRANEVASTDRAGRGDD